MTERSVPFDDTTTMSEADWRRLISLLNPDGVDDSHGSTALQVTAAVDGASVDVAVGYAHVQGSLYHNDAVLNLPVSANGGGSGRPDRCVLRYDPVANTTTANVVEGVVGAAAPDSLVQDSADKWEIPLARWTRAAGGSVTGVVNERQHITRGGLIVTSDAAITTAVPLTALFPGARAGQEVLALPSARRYRYSGAFWEKVDPGPLLDISNSGQVLLGGGGGVWTSTGTSGGGALTGTFVAPASGAVEVEGGASISPSGALAWTQVRITGPSGFDNLGDQDLNNLRARATRLPVSGGESSLDTGAVTYRETGLTPGETYTATQMYAKDSSPNVRFDLRRVTVRRA